MATSATPVRALLIGLGPNDVPADLRTLITNALDEVHTQMADAGIQYEFAAASPEEGLAELGPRVQSQRPDIVIIGNGIRSNMDLTHFMEQIIDIVRTSAPQAKLAFNTKPGNSIDAVKRWFPTVSKSV